MTSLDAPISAVSRAAGMAACAHCGADVPRGLLDPSAAQQFCCHGCQAVYATIHGCGLDQYYALREAALDGAPAPAVASADRRFEEFDDAAFRARFVRSTGTGVSQVEFALEGVHCAACLWLIERLPRLVPGVVDARLNLGRRTVRLIWDDQTVTLAEVARRLAGLGYTPHALTNDRAAALQTAEDRGYMVRIAAAGAIAGNVMLLAFALYGGMFHGIEREFAELFRWTSAGLTLVALLWPGRVFYRNALHAVRARTINMDVPVAVGLTAGMTWSLLATVRGVGEVYFDSVTLLVFLLLVGRWIQLRQQRRSADAVDLLYAMTPRHARRVDGDQRREVPIESLPHDAVVEVRAGETVPIDGEVMTGVSSIDAAWLTGESQPFGVAPGARVCAGHVNLGAPIRVRVECAGTETRAGRLMQLVEDSARRRAPIVSLADRIAGVFAIAVLVLAGVTALAWSRVDGDRALENALSLLIITCPCALGLATPLAIVAAIGRAAQRGVLIKGGAVVESLAGRTGVVYLDKTGTITEGRAVVQMWRGDETLRSHAAALESGSAHPVAQALTRAADESVWSQHLVSEAASSARGMEGVVDGRRITVGSADGVQAFGVAIPESRQRDAVDIAATGASPVFIACDGVVAAVAGVGDAVRADAAASIDSIRRLGWRVEILSGDAPEIAMRVGAAVGVEPAACRGGASPEDKLRAVEDAAARGPVIMVGDGVNDAGALAAATIGVAVRGGAEASLVAADVYLNRDGLAALPVLLNGAARTIHVIRRGLLVSLLYNVAGTTLAMAGMINPLVAAVLMPASSLTVITLALRARTFGGPRCP